MRLEIAYRTQYQYTSPVRDGTTALRLRPRSRPGLVVLDSSVRSSPGRTSATYTDGWGSTVDVVECPGSHAEISFEMRAIVETAPREHSDELAPAESLWYSRESTRVVFQPVRGLGWDLVPPSWTAVESALAWIPQRFLYQVGATDAATPIADVIALGAGVCQDFAHIYLALLRMWGFRARYVSGYFFNAPSETPRIEAEAMHAWVEAHRPGLGWVGLDATAGAYTDDRYVPVAYGRDYDDVRPIRGVIRGEAAQRSHAHLEMSQQQQ